jgi:hypothetical protein
MRGQQAAGGVEDHDRQSQRRISLKTVGGMADVVRWAGSSRTGEKDGGAATPVDDRRLQASARLPTSTSLRIS